MGFFAFLRTVSERLWGEVTPQPKPKVNERAVGRVRGLMAKAESTPYAHEAETYTAKAEQLMIRYAIDPAMLDMTARRARTLQARHVWLAPVYVAAHSMRFAQRVSAVVADVLDEAVRMSVDQGADSSRGERETPILEHERRSTRRAHTSRVAS